MSGEEAPQAIKLVAAACVGACAGIVLIAGLLFTWPQHVTVVQVTHDSVLETRASGQSRICGFQKEPETSSADLTPGDARDSPVSEPIAPYQLLCSAWE